MCECCGPPTVLQLFTVAVPYSLCCYGPPIVFRMGVMVIPWYFMQLLWSSHGLSYKSHGPLMVYHAKVTKIVQQPI